MDQMSMPQDFSVEQLRAFAASPAGQQLIRMLQNQNSENLRNAVLYASRGDTQKAKNELSSLLSDPAVQKILKDQGGKHG